MKKINTTLIFLFLGIICYAQDNYPKTREGGLSSERIERVDSFFNDLVSSKKIGGVTTIISRNNKIEYQKSFGFMDIEKNIQMNSDAIVPIASMTKVLTSIAVLQLYEQGFFLLNDPIEKYIPELKNLVISTNPDQLLTDSLETEKPRRKPTIRDFLRHTSGMTYYGGGTITDKMYSEAGFKKWDKSLQEFAKIVGEIPLSFHPGENWDYSLSHDILGYLIEVVSGQSIADYFRINILESLEMTSAGFYVTADKKANLTSLYRYKNGKLTLQHDKEESIYLTEPPVYSGGGGWSDSYCGLVCTIHDFYNLCLMLLNYGNFGDKQILSRKTVELMTSNHVRDLRDVGEGYGLGLGITTSISDYGELGSDKEVYWAGGPYNTYFWIDYKEKLIGIMFPNTAPFGHMSMMEKFKILTLQAIE